MTSIPRYIYDENGNKQFVIVPVEEWEEIKKNEKNNPITSKKISDFRGMYKLSITQIDEISKQIRSEWDRNIV